MSPLQCCMGETPQQGAEEPGQLLRGIDHTWPGGEVCGVVATVTSCLQSVKVEQTMTGARCDLFIGNSFGHSY